MAEKKRPKRRKVSYFPTAASITLVLFLLGLFGLLIIYANQLKDFVRENVQFSIYFHDSARDADIMRIKKDLDEKLFVKSTEFLSKEEAARIQSEQMGQDVVEFLGHNPLPNTIDVNLKADYAVPDSIRPFVTELRQNPVIREVNYQEALVTNIDRVVRVGGAILLFFTILFLIIAVTLINNAIRLTLFSKRFIIKSMQLVGATRTFIRRPFVLKAVFHGFLGSIIAIMLITSIIYALNNYYPELQFLLNLDYIFFLYLALILLGVGITWVSSIFALNKYLNLKLDELY